MRTGKETDLVDAEVGQHRPHQQLPYPTQRGVEGGAGELMQAADVGQKREGDDEQRQLHHTSATSTPASTGWATRYKTAPLCPATTDATAAWFPPPYRNTPPHSTRKNWK